MVVPLRRGLVPTAGAPTSGTKGRPRLFVAQPSFLLRRPTPRPELSYLSPLKLLLPNPRSRDGDLEQDEEKSARRKGY